MYTGRGSAACLSRVGDAWVIGPSNLNWSWRQKFRRQAHWNGQARKGPARPKFVAHMCHILPPFHWVVSRTLGEPNSRLNPRAIRPVADTGLPPPFRQR